ncbi:cytochrome P450 [Streptomonospora nanhaiensis]|uniref:cytochrome P450 n=1 Tax=Streptomonospora nanhaiensis TaxID=1323731 RepID=UPI001FE32235|nr:cytochrome P450 [Streptomonospora nanhaiensis]
MSPSHGQDGPPAGCPLHDNAVPLPDFTADGVDPADYLEGLRATYGALAPVDFEAGVAAWLVLDYSALAEVLKDPHRFPRASGHWREQVEGRFHPGMAIHTLFSDRGGLNALCLDGERHRRRRAAIKWALDTLGGARVRIDAAQLADIAVDGFCAEGRADIVTDFAAVVPALMLNRWFGMTQEEFGDLVECMARQWEVDADSIQAQQRLVKHGTRVAEAKRAALKAGEIGPGHDLVAALVSAPQNLTDIEIAFDLELLIAASVDPVKNLIASTVRLLLTDRAIASEVAGARVSVSDAVDRVLWTDPPIATLPGRFPTADVVIEGRTVRAGEGLVPCYLAANRDPKLGAQTLGSGNQSYLSFGAGAHACPARGMGIGAVATAVETLRRRLPDMRLAVAADDIRPLPTVYRRGPQSLPVTFTPAPVQATANGGAPWNPSNSPSGSTPEPPTSTDRPGSSVGSAPLSRFVSRVMSLFGR